MYLWKRFTDLLITGNFRVGDKAKIGLFGVTPAARPAVLTTTAAAAPAGGTGAAAGGWDTAGNRDTSITCINTTKTRVDEIETKLRALGILT